MKNFNAAFSKAVVRSFVLLALFSMAFAENSFGQCQNSTSFGSGNAPTSSTPVTFTTCAFAGEYSTMNNAVAGTTYQFSSSLAGDFLTIRQGTPGGIVIGFGTTPVTATVTASGPVYIHVNTNASCGTASACRALSATCTSCGVIPPPANDLCGNGTAIAIPSATTGTTVNSTADNAGTCTTTNTSPGVWYTFTNNVGNGSNRVVLNLCTGTTYDSKLSVYTGACGALTCVGGNDDFCGLQSQVSVTTVGGNTTYRALVHGFGTATGPFTLTAQQLASITNIALGAQTACDLNTNFYTQALTLTYLNPPTTGTLLVNGQSFPITGSPQTVVLTNLSSNGSPVNVNASFSADPASAVVLNNFFTAPAKCNLCKVVCPADIVVNLDPGECKEVVSYTVSTTGDCSAAGTVNGFQGAFAPSNWTAGLVNSNGSVNTAGAPGSVTLNGSNNGSGLAGQTNLTIPITFSGTVTFTYNYTTVDAGLFDPFGYTVNGVFTALVNGFVTAQTGTVTVNVSAGDIFGFSQRTVDNVFGPGNTTISNFSGPAAITLSPSQTAGLPSGSEFSIGSTPNTFTIPNGIGGTSTCTFNVTVLEYPNPTATLACNDLVQISLDENCSATIGADDILEGGPYGCYDHYTVMILTPLGANLGNTVNASFIGPQWTVKVIDDTNPLQSCWGHIVVEDKLKPVVDCEDLTLPCTAPSTAVGATASFSTVGTTPILDNQTATAGISVAGIPADARILDVNATIDISHTWIGDIDVDIISPAGTRFRAWNQDCANTPNIKVTFDDEDDECFNACAAYNVNDTVRPIACLLAQFPGFSDVDFLDVFDGEAAAGNWTVRAQDFFAGDQGTINKVTLAITYYSASAVYQPTVSDNCGATLNPPTDAVIEDGCGGPSRTILRTWTATDASGNTSAPCVQTITFSRPTLDDVEVPADVKWTCEQYNANGAITAATASGSGVPGVAGRPLEAICDIGVEHQDIVINVCPGSFKILRKWTLIDWCATPVDVREINQVIKVVDEAAPSIAAPADQSINVYDASAPTADPHAGCEGTVVVPPATGIADNCSGVTGLTTEIWTANSANQPVNQLGTFNGNGGVFFNIPLYTAGVPAKYVVRYYAVDGCGNQAFDDAVYTLRDKVPPVAVCDEVTEVAITNNGATGASCSNLQAHNLDDGSYDNCAPVYYLIAKMDDSFSQTIFNRCYYPSSDFCCEDIGTQKVILLVLDGDPTPFFTSINQSALGCNGTPGLLLSATANYPFNYNTCMVDVNVVDKLPPVLVSCPQNTRITCDFFADNLETSLQGLTGAQVSAALTAAGYGSPLFYDNCQANVSSNASINIDQCLEGSITRTWTAQDGSGNNSTTTCTQTIFVDHVSDWVVEFPADLSVNCGSSVPDFGEPEIFSETCELVGVSYNDQVYNVVPDACYKIERTWSVINWCVVGGDIDQEVVEATEQAMNLDLDGDGDKDNRTFRDSWTVSSKPAAAQATQSTNPDTDSDSDPWDGYVVYKQVIKVSDTVDPVFTSGCPIADVCIDGNSCGATLVLPQPAVAECSPNLTLSARVRIGGVWLNGFGPYLNVAPGTYEVLYNAKDNCNNQKDCSTTVTVKDCKKPTPVCKNGLVIEIMQSGSITVNAASFNDGSYDNCTAQGQLKLSFSANVNETTFTVTCEDSLLGQFNVNLWVTDLAGNQDFCQTYIEVQDNMGACDDPLVAGGATATEDNEGVQGVTINLNSPAGFTASTTTGAAGAYSAAVPGAGDYTITPVLDVNPLNGVTTFDLVEIRKLILFINTDFPNNTSWRFVPKSHTFSNPANPFAAQFPEVINLNDLVVASINNDFVAVKVGDVNGSASVSLTGSGDDRTMAGDLVFNTEDAVLEAGQEYTVNFKATDFNASGYQFTLNFDKENLQFVEVGAGVADASNFGLSLLSEGVITSSWNSEAAREIAKGEVVFSLTFKAVRGGRLSNMMNINSRYTAAEAYNANAELMNVALTFDNQLAGGGFELYQNTPNPFTSVTNIGFYLPEATSATLTISDVQGKVVKVMEVDAVKGFNQVNLKRGELGATGVLYYSLKTSTDSATRKMILVD